MSAQTQSKKATLNSLALLHGLTQEMIQEKPNKDPKNVIDFANQYFSSKKKGTKFEWTPPNSIASTSRISARSESESTVDSDYFEIPEDIEN